MRYAVVNKETNIVENVIELDDLNNYPLNDDFFLEESESLSPGDIMNKQ